MLLLLALLAGCAPKGLVVASGPKAPRSAGVVAVAPSALVAEVPGAVERDPFLDGYYVGNVLLSGGYILVEDPRGQQTRSKEVELLAGEGYARQVRDWLDAEVAEILVSHRVDALPAPLGVEELPAPRRLAVRGVGRADGTDNQNLPRFTLSPSALPAETLARVPPGADHLLVPYVVQYYSHNGGWFLGQTYGSGAGARFRVLWALYDARTGEPVAWADLAARHIEGAEFTPNTAQIEDYLMRVERAVARGLSKTLP